MRKIVRSFIFIFLLLSLSITPITAEVEPLGVNAEFPSFYEMNISSAERTIIGVAGVNYLVTFKVSSANKEVNLTDRYLKVYFTYFGPFYGQSVFFYKNRSEEKDMLNDTFSLSNLSTD